MPEFVEDKPRPVIHSSVAALKASTDARNAAQKADLQYQQPEAMKKLTMAVASLGKQLEGLRERIELLESENGVGGTPYSDGPI